MDCSMTYLTSSQRSPRALSGHLHPRSANVSATVPCGSSENLTAYDCLLQALDPLFAMERSSFARARGLLQRAIAYDPEYGPAYSYSAYWYLLRVGQGWSTDTRRDTIAA